MPAVLPGGRGGTEFRTFAIVGGGALGREPFTLPAEVRNVGGTERTVVAGTVVVFKNASSTLQFTAMVQTELEAVTLQYCTVGVYRVDSGGTIDDWIWVDTDAQTTIPQSDNDLDILFDDGVQGGGDGGLTLNADNLHIEIADAGFYAISGDAVFVDS